MTTTAFIGVSPAVARSASTFLTASLTVRPRTVPVTPAVVPHRSATIVMGEKQKIPQGFTLFSEQLNGRAAMIGFALAVVTEIITGQGILGQLASVTENAHAVLPF